jgi:trimethylamine--corrinoid protein Co-methyltransferase
MRMKAKIQILSADERDQIHERSLKLLATTGVRVHSKKARSLLGKAGARVNETSQIVQFPRSLVEECIKLVPRIFKLGGRRPGWDLEMNIGECSLLADGGAVSVLDWETGEIRPGTFDDWLQATHLIDALDEIGVYWNMVEGGFAAESLGDYVSYWRNVFKNCSKHVQDSTDTPEKSRLLLEILQVTFGDKKTIRQTHPFSYILCPMSPLVIDETYADAYLELTGWDIPVALMPMPLMGATGPASMISSILLANSEALAALCMVQVAEPGVPILYSPFPQSIEPYTWRYTGGAVENSLFGAATIEMGRYYGFPVEAATGGTDQYYPGAQASYERAINWALPTIGWPDILVGPGLLGGSTILCLEQMVMDVEIFRRSSRLYEGIPADADRWLDDIIAEAGPGGNFLNQKSTLKAVREGRWYLSEMGFHDTYEKWKEAGMPDIIDEIQEITGKILKNYQPLPLDNSVDRELERLERHVRGKNKK